MTIPEKQLANGFSLPVYGIGTWGMGGWQKPNTNNDERFIDAIRQAVEAGVNHIDTAEMYGKGHAEELIASAVEGIDRSKLTITSKVSVGMDGGYDGVMRACEASLKRLKTDYLDLYLLHTFPEHSTDECMKALDRLVSEGMVRHIGVSNFTNKRFEYVQDLTENKLVCNQVHYSLECREVDIKGVLDYCQSNDVLLSAWGPLSKGLLKSNPLLDSMSAKYSKTPYQIALNWLIAQKNVVVIAKTSSTDHLTENLGAIGWEMEQSDLQNLTENFPGQVTVSDRFHLDYEAEIAP